MIIFLYGEDSFRSSEKLKEIKNKFRGSGTVGSDPSVFDFSEKGNEDLIQSFGSQGLFSTKRLVIIKNLISSGLKNRQDEVLEYLKKNKGLLADDDLTIIFWEEKVPAKNKTLFKFLEKEAEIKKQNFEKLVGAKLSDWVQRKIKEVYPKGKISKGALEKLVAYAGEDVYVLSTEIEKLVSFANGKEIQEEMVEILVKANVESNIFETIDALGANNKSRALELLHNHLEKGDDPFYILSMFVYQFRNLLKVADFSRRGISNEYEISKLTKLHPFVVKKSLFQLRNLSFEKLKIIYQKLADVDLAVKTGKIDIKIALDKFIVEL